MASAKPPGNGNKRQDVLRKAGLRVTPPRTLILDKLRTLDHISAEDLHKSFISDDIGISPATIYRVLGDLLDAGLVEKHSFRPNHSVYELTKRGHHDHLICVDCGCIIEFMDPVIEKRQEAVAAEHQLEMTDHVMYLYGNCKRENCPERAKVDADD